MIQKVHLVKDEEEINRLYEFIKKLPLDYPGYLDWAEKCFRELQLGYKKAFVYKPNGHIVANLIFQKHKKDPKIIELKNGRVEKHYQRKKLFTLLYKAVEEYARKNNFLKIVGDTHKDNIPVLKTLKELGFNIEAEQPLYERGKLEIILSKEL